MPFLRWWLKGKSEAESASCSRTWQLGRVPTQIKCMVIGVLDHCGALSSRRTTGAELESILTSLSFVLGQLERRTHQEESSRLCEQRARVLWA